MKNFDLQSHLNAIYATFPQSRRQPVIGLTTNFNDNNAMLLDRYYRLVVAAGATPMLRMVFQKRWKAPNINPF